MKKKDNAVRDEHYAAWVGFDWGDQEHVWAHAALRALAFKWQRILFRCWNDGVTYDEAKYVASLKKRSSPLGMWLPE